MDKGTVGIAIGIIQLSVIVIQWYIMSKSKKWFKTILSTIWKKAKNIESNITDVEGATGNELASGHASVKSDASAILNEIDEFRRHHWKQKPPSSS